MYSVPVSGQWGSSLLMRIGSLMCVTPLLWFFLEITDETFKLGKYLQCEPFQVLVRLEVIACFEFGKSVAATVPKVETSLCAAYLCVTAGVTVGQNILT